MGDLWTYTTAFGLGFFGGAHCIGMCGGIMAALSFAVPEANRSERLLLLLSYNIGRISSYTIMGVLLGSLGALADGGHGLSVLRLIAGALLIAMGLYLGNWWRGLTLLEKAGGFLWRFIQPLGKRLMPVTTAPQALLLGGLWGWLPCGLIYSALAYAATMADVLTSGLTMLAFGLGTLPAVLASGLLAEKFKSLIQQRNVRAVFALAVIGFGIWTLMAANSHSQHSHSRAHSNQHEHHAM